MSYHASIWFEPKKVFHGCIQYKVLSLKTGIHPQKRSTPISQVTQSILEQTKLIHQDLRKNTMQAHIKYKEYYEKKLNASELRERDCAYVLWTNAVQKWSKNPATILSRSDPCFVENASSNDNYLVCKVRTDKTPVPLCMNLRPFTPRQPVHDIQTTSQYENLTLWWPSNMMIRTPEHGSLHLKSLYLTTAEIDLTYLVHPKSQCNLTKQTTIGVPFQASY